MYYVYNDKKHKIKPVIMHILSVHFNFSFLSHVRRPNNKLFGPPDIVWSMTLTLDVCQVTLPKIVALAIFRPKSTRSS